jgi:type VI secretion system protein
MTARFTPSWLRSSAKQIALGLGLLGLSACGEIFQHAATSQVSLIATPTANQNSAIEVDVVAIYNDALLKTLLTIPARQWFPNKAQYALDYPQGFKAWNWQLVPGQTVPSQDLSTDTDIAYGVLVFANYRTDGDHRARIGSLEKVTITLEQKGFTVLAVQ